MILDTEQLASAAKSMARGISRVALINKFEAELRNSPDIGYTEQELRDHLSDELAKADPNSNRFQENRYGNIVAIEQDVLRATFTEGYAEARDSLIQDILADIDDDTKDIELLDEALAAYKPQPTITAEWKTLYELRAKTRNEKRDKRERLVSLLGRLQQDPDNRSNAT